MSDPKQLAVDLIFGRWRSQITYSGVKLGVFDALGSSSKNSIQVAFELGLDEAMTYRLLRALASIGLLKEDNDGSFSVTNAGSYLRSDHPESLRGITLLEEGPQHYAIWKHLPDMIRDGNQDGFVREFGHPIFKYTTQDPDYCAVFNEAMSSFSMNETAMVIEALQPYDFSSVSHMCDVGGGHGHLLCSILDNYKHMQGTIYDLPYVFEQKDALWAKRMNLENRCEHVAGDMFESVPAADAYIMKHILHDWNDDECVQILKNIHSTAPDNAKVFIAEVVVPGPDTPHFSKLFDIHMICATSGRERTEEEYNELLEKSGFKPAGVWYPESRFIGVVEGVKS